MTKSFTSAGLYRSIYLSITFLPNIVNNTIYLFVYLAILILRDRGRLHLDDLLSVHIPEIKNSGQCHIV
jgi:hypothetical protein